MLKHYQRWIWIFISSCLLFTAWNLIGSEHQRYPATPRIPTTTVYHGTEVTDNYQWLEEGSHQHVLDWTDAQNKITSDYLQNISQYQWAKDCLEPLCRYDHQTFGDVLEGTRRFVWERKANQECWTVSVQDSPEAPLKLLLDPNQWPKGETLEFASPSRDGSYLAFAKAKNGDETPVIYIMEVATGKILTDTLKGTKQGWPVHQVAWLPQNQGFLYSANPEPGEKTDEELDYWNAVYYHRLGTSSADDVKVFEDLECKEMFHSADVSEDGKWVIFTRSRSSHKTQAYLIAVERLLEAPQPITTLFDASYSVMAVEDKLLILTNRDAPNYQLFITDIHHPEQESWKLLVPETKDRLLSADAIAGRIYLHYLHNASSTIKAIALDGSPLETVPLPTLGSASVSGYWSKPETWLHFTSFTVPGARYRYYPENGKTELVYAISIPFNPDAYTVEQVWYPSKDGTPISMFLIQERGLKKNGEQPVILAGYGGFDVSITPAFSETLVAFLDAGGVAALPNLRGGGEYGEAWHRGGMKENKQNVFDDFIGAAEWLIAQGYTNPHKLAIRGGSNGGLLIGAALTQRPDLFQAALCEVPLLDMLRFHHFGFANIWTDEYGCADHPEQFDYLFRYSPYHNVKDQQHYPATLIVAAENDSRVDPLHARKMTARLQHADPEGPLHLLLIAREAGHTGETTVSAKMDHKAYTLGFLMDQLGMK